MRRATDTFPLWWSAAEPQARALIMLAAGRFAVTFFAQERNPALHDSRILKMAKVLGASNEKAGKCYETGAVVQRPWTRYNGDGTWTVIHFGSLL
jgi:hypothetical protein